MKKSIILFASLAMLGGMASCSDDQDPKYKAPTTFVLNQPALGDQYFELTPGGTFELVASQPDYGYSAITQYSAEVSLTEDFADFRTIVPAETQTDARMVFNDFDLSYALNELDGFTEEDDEVDMPERKVYFRAVAELENVEGSRIVSNIVSFDRVKPYFAMKQQGFIYLIGNPGGWTGPEASNADALAEWMLYEAEDAIGSKIYSGTFEFPASPAFRFYTKLTGWDGGDSFGSQEADANVTFEIEDGIFQGPLMKGKGNYSFPDFEGGQVRITVDMSVKDNYVVTLETL